ncbi:hypothetical protein ABLB84_17145 [Xenorhabdus szentirmaii]|uniref:hypothetical protein n=1 Tax=Xenorhabdus szentirmaii TaxID=290112 RepID=UPI0032B804E1
MILTSDRIIDKSDYANQRKSSGQWVIHFLAQKVMSGKRWDLGLVEQQASNSHFTQWPVLVV